MNWEWKDMFPRRKLLSYTILSLLLSVASVMVHGLFKNDVSWFLVCGSIFAGVYLGLVIYYGKRLADD